LRDHEAELRAAGASVAAIGLGGLDYANEFRRDARIPFPLLIDDKREAYRAARLKSASLLHLIRSDNFAARKRAKAAGHSQHRLGQHPLQLGGSFVFAPGNVDRFVHLSETFGDNASVAKLLEVVRAA
jgi:hypothetical protein